MSNPIITAPHPTLRKKAQPIKKVDKKLLDNIKLLITALDYEQDPQGVGLAFPQINKSLQAFAFKPDKITAENFKKESREAKILLNPTIKAHSSDKTFGTDPDEPDYEGCLSIPNVYGPVPRWTWVELEYQIIKNKQLTTQNKKFTAYAARIVQHELDHLQGILFTDYLLKLNLPAYLKQGDQFIEMTNRDLLKVY